MLFSLAGAALLCLGSAAMLISQTAVGQPEADDLPAAVTIEPEEESPLLVEPKTPTELFKAVTLMHKIGRPVLAKRYLDQLIATQPDDDLLVDLRDQYGPALFLNLANSRGLHPSSIQLLELVNDAFRRQSTDPRRVDVLVADLSGTPDARTAAIAALRDGGQLIVPQILTHIGAAETARQRDPLFAVLMGLGSQAVAPLVGALESPHEEQRRASIEVLGALGAREAVPYLWQPAFAESQPAAIRAVAQRALAQILRASTGSKEPVSSFGAARELQRMALVYLRDQYPWKVEEDGRVPLWIWLTDTNATGIWRATPREATMFRARQFSRQALDLAPEAPDLQALFVASALAYTAHTTESTLRLPSGPGTAHNLALSAGAATVAHALTLFMENADAVGAVAALHVLKQIGTKRQLMKTGSDESPVIAALNYPNPRVQFAAATAILETDPDKSFPRAADVVRVLARALNNADSRGCLVIDANEQRGGSIGGLMGSLNLRPQLARTGRDGFRIASERIDIELILLNANTIRWGLSQTIANLRADARTAAIPLVVYGPKSLEPRLLPLLKKHERLTFMVESTTLENIESQIGRLLKRLREAARTPEQRAAQSAQAAFWLAHIANGYRTNLYDLAAAESNLILASHNPEIADNAVRALAAIPSRAAQQELQELTLSDNYDIDLRISAALHLAFHVQRFGLLLSQKQIAELKTSWRSGSPPELATALAAVVGSLKPNAKRVGTRLRRFPKAVPPTP
jgi:hypothetical protein